MVYSSPLVGSFYRSLPDGRKYGPAALNCLPADHELALRRDPTNEYDPNAIEVLLRTASLADHPDLELYLAGAGIEKEEFLSELVRPIGFVARDIAQQWSQRFPTGQSVRAWLTFSPQGKHMVSTEFLPANPTESPR